MYVKISRRCKKSTVRKSTQSDCSKKGKVFGSGGRGLSFFPLNRARATSATDRMTKIRLNRLKTELSPRKIDTMPSSSSKWRKFNANHVKFRSGTRRTGANMKSRRRENATGKARKKITQAEIRVTWGKNTAPGGGMRTAEPDSAGSSRISVAMGGEKQNYMH